MDILKKINKGIIFALMFEMYVSFILQFENATVSYCIGLLILGEILFLCVEQGKEESKKVEQFIYYAKLLYSLDFSNLQNIKDIVINHDSSFTIILQNNLNFTYKIDLMPISQDALEAWDIKFDELKTKENKNGK